MALTLAIDKPWSWGQKLCHVRISSGVHSGDHTSDNGNNARLDERGSLVPVWYKQRLKEKMQMLIKLFYSTDNLCPCKYFLMLLDIITLGECNWYVLHK